MTNKIGILAYEQPSLKKYGSMKKLTLNTGGSGADVLGIEKDPNTSDRNTPNDPSSILIDDRGKGPDLLFFGD